MGSVHRQLILVLLFVLPLFGQHTDFGSVRLYNNGRITATDVHASDSITGTHYGTQYGNSYGWLYGGLTGGFYYPMAFTNGSDAFFVGDTTGAWDTYVGTSGHFIHMSNGGMIAHTNSGLSYWTQTFPNKTGTLLVNTDTTVLRAASDSMYARKAAVNIFTETNYFKTLFATHTKAESLTVSSPTLGGLFNLWTTRTSYGSTMGLVIQTTGAGYDYGGVGLYDSLSGKGWSIGYRDGKTISGQKRQLSLDYYDGSSWTTVLILDTNRRTLAQGPFASAGLTPTGTYGVSNHTDTVTYTGMSSGFSKNLTSTGGMYRLTYTIFCTTADAAAGTVQLTLSFNNGAAQTMTSAAVSLTSTANKDDDVFVFYVASGTPSISTAITGSAGTSKHSVHAIVERLK